MMRISYPASNKGVEMARMPSGAVASMLENEATKNTIFFDDFTRMPFGANQVSKYQSAAHHLSRKCQNYAKSARFSSCIFFVPLMVEALQAAPLPKKPYVSG